MFSRQVASVMAAGLFASCLFAQGLQTKATKDDWEEINFEFNSAILSDGYPTLLRIAELLQQHKDYKIKVEGHTDYVGSVPYNEKLALARGKRAYDKRQDMAKRDAEREVVRELGRRAKGKD